MAYDVTISPAVLSGTIDAPSSKSKLHRAIICSALAQGESRIWPYYESDDILATLKAVSAFGASYTIENDSLIVKGSRHLQKPKKPIDVHASASTLRFLIPIAALTGEKVDFILDDTLANRPQDVYKTLFNEGLIQKNNRLTVHHTLSSDDYFVDGQISSQFITGLLMALPLLKASSTITINGILSSKAYVDLTVDTLQTFGIKIDKTEHGFFIPGHQHYHPASVTIDGDYSQAAFFLIAGLFHPSVRVQGLDLVAIQSDRTLVEYIKAMRGKIIVNEDGFTTTKSQLEACDLSLNQTPDLLPIVALALSLANGTSTLKDLTRLRFKESDRIETTMKTLNALGANISRIDDTLVIEGVKSLKGGVTVDSYSDHRIAMMLAIAGSITREPIRIKQANAIKKSYPTFFEDYLRLGGKVTTIKRPQS